MAASRISLALLYPRPVRVEFGGVPMLAEQFRVRHLLALDRWMLRRVADPLASVPAAADDPDPSTRAVRVCMAGNALMRWPPRVGSERGSDLLASPRGAVLFARLVLRRTEGLDAAGVAALVPHLTATDWATLNRVAWGADPLEELKAEVDGEDGEDDREPIDWEEALCSLARDYGIGHRAALSLYLSQLDCYRRGGAPRPRALGSASEYLAWHRASGGKAEEAERGAVPGEKED